MHLFTDYLQPLTSWISFHPNWALLIAFLVSFSESLAIIGSIVPGSVTMTAIGILAGSGIMRIDLTLIAAILGAIAGDSISYTLGYTFRNRLLSIWPFSHYPSWLKFGKDYFARHGGKSVLLGRFVGPLRSIIPLIAGMLHMNRWHFLIANVISAVGWSLLYVMPGILIGAASSELSAESASRLFVVILILLAIIWIIGLSIRWLVQHINSFLRNNLRKLWLWSKTHRYLSAYCKIITPVNEVDHYPTAALLLIFLLSVVLSLAVTLVVLQGTWISELNNVVYLFLQSVRTHPFDVFFIIASLLIKPASLIALMLSIILYTLYFRDWRTLRYWLILCGVSVIVNVTLANFIAAPDTEDLLKEHINLFYPAIDLSFATALFGFLIFYTSTRYRTTLTLAIRVLLLIILLLNGVGSIYLGDNRIGSVVGAYLIGTTISITHWIFYRRALIDQNRSQLPIIFSCSILVFTTALSYPFVIKGSLKSHQTSYQQYVIAEEAWWQQHTPLLPLYTTNRIGHRTHLLNVQYVGSMNKLQQSLAHHGWKNQSTSFFYTLLVRVGGKNSVDSLPLMAQLYLNRKPSLMMTYSSSPGKPLLVLRLWRSNYHLQHYNKPIWLGSLLRQVKKQKEAAITQSTTSPFAPLYNALPGFQFNQLALPADKLMPLQQGVTATLLIIREHQIQ